MSRLSQKLKSLPLIYKFIPLLLVGGLIHAYNEPSEVIHIVGEDIFLDHPPTFTTTIDSNNIIWSRLREYIDSVHNGILAHESDTILLTRNPYSNYRPNELRIVRQISSDSVTFSVLRDQEVIDGDSESYDHDDWSPETEHEHNASRMIYMVRHDEIEAFPVWERP